MPSGEVTDFPTGGWISHRHEPVRAVEHWPGLWHPVAADWTLSVVIPAYNEEERILPTLREYIGALSARQIRFEILVVFDGTDRTPEVVRSLNDRRVAVAEFREKLGRGGAIFEGLRRVHGDIIAYADADGSVGATDLVHLVDLVARDDLVAIASRRLDPTRVVVPETRARRFVGGVWHALIKALLGVRVKDVQCGLKVFRRSVVEMLVREVAVTNRTFEVDLVYHLGRHGIPIDEVAVAYRHDFRTRMPITKAVPVMFLFLVGVFLANNRVGRRVVPQHVFERVNAVFSTT
ncbi:MAG TPA: glycosyltransferase [Thermoplasmata archaeon]|nr:glycosyltransferase [Thermoplasmata archaeon]HTW77417.1 glycosyltransferase [Thermoplasmata archaeon]